MFKACREGRVDEVCEQLSKAQSLIQLSVNGVTPAYLAAQSGSVAVLKILASKGANLNSIVHADGTTPLYVASNRGWVDTVQFLCTCGVEINAKALNGYTAVLIAAKKGHTAVVRTLAEHGADLEIAAQDGSTPLHAAVHNGHNAMVELLLELGASPNALLRSGESPLSTACRLGHTSIAELLVDAGAYTNPADSAFSPLNAAIDSGDTALVELLLQRGAVLQASSHIGVWKTRPRSRDNMHPYSRACPVTRAAALGRSSMIQLLADHGASIHGTIDSEVTPLVAAIVNGHCDVVSMLLRCGVNHDIAPSGRTPIFCTVHDASLAGRKQSARKMLKLLFEHGADADRLSRVRDGLTTPLHDAVTRGSIDLLHMLLNYGAQPSVARTADGATPLHLAAGKGALLEVDLLLKYNADLDALNHAGQSAMYFAAARGNLAIIRALADRGADPSLRGGSDAMSPATIAARNGHLEAVQYLGAYGADLRAATINGLCPIKAATAANHHHIRVWLDAVAGWSALEIAAGCRLHRIMRSSVQRGILDPEEVVPRRLLSLCTTAAERLWPWALGPCRTTTKLVKDCIRGWSPSIHMMFHSRFRRRIHEILVVRQRLCATDHKRLPSLPTELWLRILWFLRRNWC